MPTWLGKVQDFQTAEIRQIFFIPSFSLLVKNLWPEISFYGDQQLATYGTLFEQYIFKIIVKSRLNNLHRFKLLAIKWSYNDGLIDVTVYH